MVARTAEADRVVVDEVRASLTGLTAGSIVVRDVEVERVEDLTEALVWQVRLTLDAPASGSWDVNAGSQMTSHRSMAPRPRE